MGKKTLQGKGKTVTAGFEKYVFKILFDKLCTKLKSMMHEDE